MKERLKIHRKVFETVFSFKIEGTPVEVTVPTPPLPTPTPTPPTPSPTEPPYPPLNNYPGIYAPPVPPQYWGSGIEWVEVYIRELRDFASGEGMPGGTVYKLCTWNGNTDGVTTLDTSACCSVMAELVYIDETTPLGRYPSDLVPLIQYPPSGQRTFKDIWFETMQTGTNPSTFLLKYYATPPGIYEGDYHPSWDTPIFPLTEVWGYYLSTDNPVTTN